MSQVPFLKSPATKALLGYVILAVVFTWPLLLHVDTHVIGEFPGDNFEYVWKTWWIADALRRGESPLVYPYMGYPDGYELAQSEITPIHTVLLLPLTLTLGEVVTYNLAMLLTVVLSGWFVFLLCRRWYPKVPAPIAFIAGMEFALCPYRVGRIHGHLNLAGTQYLPLALIALDRWLDSRRTRDAFFIGLSVALAGLSSWYYAFMLGVMMPVYLLARGDGLRAMLADRRSWAGLGTALLTVAVLAGPFLIPYLQLAGQGVTNVPMENVVFWAASPVDYIVPNPRHIVWGSAVQRLLWPFSEAGLPYEFMIAIGWVTLVFGFIGWRRTAGKRWRATKWMIGVAFVLSLGPELKIGPLPVGVPLPLRLLWEVVPGIDTVRSWGRFSVFVLIGMVALAAAGASMWLAERSFSPQRKRQVIVGGLVLVYFLAWIGPMPLVEVKPRPVDEWLAAQPGHDPLMQFPLHEALNGPAMFYTRYHEKPALFGYGVYYPFRFREKYPEFKAFPGDEALDTLADLGVRWVVVRTDVEDYTMQAVNTSPRLAHRITLENQAVYELVR